MQSVTPLFLECTREFKAKLDADEPIEILGSFMNSLKQSMIDDMVRNFKMRVRNMIYIVDFDKVMAQVREFCHLTSQVLEEFQDVDARKFLKDTIKAVYHSMKNGNESDMSMSMTSDDTKSAGQKSKKSS